MEGWISRNGEINATLGSSGQRKLFMNRGGELKGGGGGGVEGTGKGGKGGGEKGEGKRRGSGLGAPVSRNQRGGGVQRGGIPGGRGECGRGWGGDLKGGTSREILERKMFDVSVSRRKKSGVHSSRSGDLMGGEGSLPGDQKGVVPGGQKEKGG